eukprot:jgi/Galph1/507/GphlegSOOS_G5197.1
MATPPDMSSSKVFSAWLRNFNRRPVAQKDSFIFANNGTARFTVINEHVLRCELGRQTDGSYSFEDRASFGFLYRENDYSPTFHVQNLSNNGLLLQTSVFRLRYVPTGPNQTNFQDQLYVQLQGDSNEWKVEKDYLNLGGTYRTLDQADGWHVVNWKGERIGEDINLGLGVVSKRGISVIDDSDTPLFDESGWPVSRNARKNICDIYIFCYGSDYRKAVKLLCQVSGYVPLIPRYALGNWWSRYWRYSERELKNLILNFEKHKLPLSVCIIDMDWHIVDCDPKDFQVFGCHVGWTGYTWNRELFPNPAAFISWLHERGIRTALNLHPADGIWPHEEQYEDFRKAMGLPTEIGKKPIQFEITDPWFTENYFCLLHHPQEETNGVDFWWIDWQQGTTSSLEGVDPLFVLNHFHYLDHGRKKSRRPWIFSRYPGIGGQRYPIGFSGDTHVTWNSLAFQPYFTSTAANVAYFYWSHDIGGHFAGIEEAELLVRWIQFGVVSPILRLHSNKNPYNIRHPWAYDAETLRLCQLALRLRHQLIPYLYSMAWRCTKDCVPLIEPMYYEHPSSEEAYVCPGQYYFGSELIVAPFVEPKNAEIHLARQVVWLPLTRSPWRNIFTGEAFKGGQWHSVYGKLEDIPVFGRPGAIIPFSKDILGTSHLNAVENPHKLELIVVGGGNGHFELYEDDDRFQPVVEDGGGACITLIDWQWLEQEDKTAKLIIHGATGDTKVIPEERDWKITLIGVVVDLEVLISSQGESHTSPLETAKDCQIESNEERESFSVYLGRRSIHEKIEVIFRPSLRVSNACISSVRDRQDEKIRQLLFSFQQKTIVKELLDDSIPLLKKEPEKMNDISHHFLTETQKRALYETLMSSGCHYPIHSRPNAPFVAWRRDNSVDIQVHWFSPSTSEKRHVEWKNDGSFIVIENPTQLVDSKWELQVNHGKTFQVTIKFV